MPARRQVIFGALAATLTAAVTVAFPAVARPGHAHASFSRPMILLGGGAEPSIRVPADGKSAAYVSAPTGLGSNFWRITKKRYRDGSVQFLQSPVQQPDDGTGGGDSEISVGDITQQSPPHSCAPVAYSGLHNIDLLDNFTVATSTDCGNHFTTLNPFATQNTLTDRQWQVFDGTKTNFLIYHLVSTGQIAVSVSPDAGQHYVSLGASNANGIIDPKLLAASGPLNQQIGNIIVNHAEPIRGATNVVSGEPVHAMYAIFGITDDGADATAASAPGADYNYLDNIYVGKSVDGGVTWKDTKVFGVNPASKRELNMLFPVITADSVGNLYALWSDTYKIEYSVSTDHGAHWSKPLQINRDNRGVGAHGSDRPDPGKADVFPWIAAGGKGLVDIVWYHGQGGAAKSNLVYRDPGDAKTRWTVAFAQLRDANRVSKGTPKPAYLDYNEAITPVVHIGDICQNGTLCSLVPVPGAPFSTGDRSLLDFFQVAIDKEGRANLAIADNTKSPGQLFSAYTIQTTGYSVTTGRKLAPLHVRYAAADCTSIGTFTDPKGDATQYAVDTPAPSQDGLDLREGWVTWNANTKVATFHLKVTNLGDKIPAGSSGQIFRFWFGWATKGYGVEADRDVTTGTAFRLLSHGSGFAGDLKVALKGTFDDAHNEVRVELPANAFAKASDDAYKAPPLTSGGAITGLAAESRRSYPSTLAPVADVATGVCPALLPAHSGAMPSGFLPAAPQIGRAAADLLPGTLAALLVGLAVTAVSGSRRRVLAA